MARVWFQSTKCLCNTDGSISDSITQVKFNQVLIQQQQHFFV